VPTTSLRLGLVVAMMPSRAIEPVPLLSDDPAVLRFLATYLQVDPGVAHVEFLAGGVSSAVVRVSVDGACFVIKQALPQLRVELTWLSRPERSGIEARCAEVLARLVPGSVPAVLRVVPEVHAFVMECAPAGSETWKAYLMHGAVDLETARAAGQLLGRIHTTTAGVPTLEAEFADTSFFTELRIEPYLYHAAGRHPELATRLAALGQQVGEPGICLVHGDYSPKNILVTPGGRLLLLDHEVAHWGQPAFDVAFVVSHLCLKALHFRGSFRHLEAARVLLEAYRAGSSVADAATGALCGGLLAALMLARVDGKSPVEYLSDGDKELVRGLAGRILPQPAATPDAVLAAVHEVGARA
jgi:aminoglycoside phosphotransferase (APT) family kinase protein